MSGINSVGGVSANAAFQIAALKQQKNVMEEQGQMMVDLIQSSAVLDPGVGKKLNVSA